MCEEETGLTQFLFYHSCRPAAPPSRSHRRDLRQINGRQDQLEGKIQERYGLAKDQAKKDVDAWFKSLP
jgi:hypothetical protein